MKYPITPPVKFYLPISMILFIIGWGGVALLVTNTLPTVGPRWLFFFLIVLALAGSFLPVVAFLNLRFPSLPPASASIVIRQATWIGLFGATLAWLQIGRVLSFPMVLLLLVGFTLIEFLLRLSERSQWKPTQEAGSESTGNE
jgi:hypothetical protein